MGVGKWGATLLEASAIRPQAPASAPAPALALTAPRENPTVTHSKMKEVEEVEYSAELGAPGREGCSSLTACIGMPESQLFRLSGGYVGIFCERCIEILKESEPNLTS